MITAAERIIEIHPEGVAKKRYIGEVVYIYAYDVAYEMKREPVLELLGQKVEPFEFDVIYAAHEGFCDCQRAPHLEQVRHLGLGQQGGPVAQRGQRLETQKEDVDRVEAVPL